MDPCHEGEDDDHAGGGFQIGRGRLSCMTPQVRYSRVKFGHDKPEGLRFSLALGIPPKRALELCGAA